MHKRVGWLIGVTITVLMVMSQSVSALKIAFPSYIYPSSDYNTIIKSDAVQIVMFNPNSGPGASADAAYTAQLDANKAAGRLTYGYLGTGYFCAPSTSTDPTAGSPYANRCPIATIKSGIDAWKSQYPKLDGIFFDEADTGKYPGSKNTKATWDELISYASSKGLKSIVNFGVDGFDDSLSGLDAILVNFEGNAQNYLGTSFQHTGSKYYHIVYSVADGDIDRVAAKAANSAGYVHITSLDQQSGAYTQLPSNWSKVTAAVSGSSGTVTTPSTPTGGSTGTPASGSGSVASPTAKVLSGPEADCKDANKIDESNCGIIKYLNLAFDILSGIVLLAVIANIVISGIMYSMSQGDPSGVGRAKKRIIEGLLAFLMYFMLYGFLQWLIPGGAF